MKTHEIINRYKYVLRYTRKYHELWGTQTFWPWKKIFKNKFQRNKNRKSCVCVCNTLHTRQKSEIADTQWMPTEIRMWTGKIFILEYIQTNLNRIGQISDQTNCIAPYFRHYPATERMRKTLSRRINHDSYGYNQLYSRVRERDLRSVILNYFTWNPYKDLTAP